MSLLSARLYRGVTRLVEPLAPAVLRLAARGEDEALRAERLGRGGAPADTWWHAASLGELAALEPVLARARTAGLAGRFWVTTTSVPGRAAARARWDEAAGLAPLDLPGATNRFLDARRPRALLIVETELWPNWLLETRRRGTAVGIVNGRISDRAWPRYRRVAGVLRPGLAALRAVAAREPRDAERFRALGVPGEALRVTGNTKHDRAPAPPAPLPWNGEPVWVVGSLRPGEEDAVLDAFVALRARTPLRLVVAPRHPEEWPDPIALLRRRGLRGALRTRPGPGDGEAPVLWVDRLGELAGLYAAATVAFVGGTLVPVGGHNLAEAAASGIPVCFGPHTANVRADAEALLAQGGGRRVTGSEDLGAALGAWLDDPRALAEAGAGARRAVGKLGGGADAALAWLVEREVLCGGG